MIEKYGVTTDGKPVVRGLFRFFETTGFPLSMLLDECWNRGMVPGWMQLLQEMDDAGVSKPGARIRSAVSESFLPKEVKERVLSEFSNVS